MIADLKGHQMSDHHRRMIRYSVDHMRFLEEQIAQLDKDIAATIQQAGLELQWQLLQSVPGVQETSAAAILAETGTDMSQFPSEKHISSWAGICPGNNRSAGKNRSSHTHCCPRRDRSVARPAENMCVGRTPIGYLG
jgi:transposase